MKQRKNVSKKNANHEVVEKWVNQFQNVDSISEGAEKIKARGGGWRKNQVLVAASGGWQRRG